MKNTGIVAALLLFVVLLFVVIGLRGGDDKVGVKELKIEKIDKDKVTKIEVTLPAKKKAGDDAGDGKPAAESDETSQKRQVVLEKDGESWKVFDPAHPDRKFAADEAQVKVALDATGDLGMGDLISTKADKLATYEIDDESGHVVKVHTPAGTALDLVFGRPAKGGGSTVRLAGSNEVFIAKGRLGNVMKKELSAWRKKTLFDIKAEDVARVKTTLADGRFFTVEQEKPEGAPADAADAGPVAAPKASWALAEPAELPAGFRLDDTQLGRPAATLASLRAQDFADGVSDADAGFDAAHTIVEATTRDGKTLKVHVGKEDDKKRVFAKVDGAPQVYLLANYNAKQLAKSLDDLRDLTLLTAKVEDVEKVAFTGSTRVVVERDGDAWKLVEPKTAPAGFEVDQILPQVNAVLRTRAARVAVDAPRDAVAKAGPVIELSLKGGKKQALRFGAPLPVDATTAAATETKEPREYFVKGGADDLVYVMPAFARNRYDKPAELFKKPALPTGPVGGPGQIPGMDKLPPDVRKKLEESLKKGDFPRP